MKKIALIAYAVSQKYGSEYAVGWEFINHMARTGEYRFVVYYGSTKSGLIGNTEVLPYIENVSWKFVGLPDDFKNRLYWLIRKKIYYVFGFYFQLKEWHQIVAKQICKDNSIEKYDLIHYLNPIGIKEPGESWKINIPYVWGPLQGVETWPKCLINVLDTKGKVEAYIRKFIQNYILRHSSRLRRAIERADIVIAATPNTCIQIKNLYHKQSFYLPENGLKEFVGDVRKYVDGSVLQIIWVGELSNRKGLILLLMALKDLGNLKDNVHLSVFGDGAYRVYLQNYIICNGLSQCVTFYGKVDRSVVQKEFLKSHLHVITSLSEATTTVIWEAKACGVPTMTLDHCGMSGVVNNENGIKISLTSLSQVVNDIELNIIKILKNPSIIERLSRGVLKSNFKYMWRERCNTFRTLYLEAIANYNNKCTKR